MNDIEGSCYACSKLFFPVVLSRFELFWLVSLFWLVAAYWGSLLLLQRTVSDTIDEISMLGCKLGLWNHIISSASLKIQKMSTLVCGLFSILIIPCANIFLFPRPRNLRLKKKFGKDTGFPILFHKIAIRSYCNPVLLCLLNFIATEQFVIFKPLSYCF